MKRTTRVIASAAALGSGFAVVGNTTPAQAQEDPPALACNDTNTSWGVFRLCLYRQETGTQYASSRRLVGSQPQISRHEVWLEGCVHYADHDECGRYTPSAANPTNYVETQEYAIFPSYKARACTMVDFVGGARYGPRCGPWIYGYSQ